MSTTLDQLAKWMLAKENEHLEFKEAKNNFDFDTLVKYCTALANEGGGRIVFGMTDKPPRKVVGTKAFQDLERTKAGIVERLRIRIDADELMHPDGRVLIFRIPSHPLGMPIQYKGAYWMRAGESLVPMTPDQLKGIFDEGSPDFSAEICTSASITDLSPDAIELLRSLWMRKSGNSSLGTLSHEQLLRDAELIVDRDITYAALILLGTREALGKHISQSEIVFEYRSSEASLSAQQRKEYREGFLLYQDDLLNTINLRNEIQQFHSGLFVWDIPTFNEVVVREAILNAVSHRDYRLAGSVFVRQYPRKMEIINPGGFPPGITEQNILDRQSPRNRRIAEVFSRCGLVERSGQGVNRMYEESIRESKAVPDFAGTDDYQVSLTLRGEVQDPQFLRFLEQVGRETLSSFDTHDFLALDSVHRGLPVPEYLRSRLLHLADIGVMERVGRGRSRKYILSRRFYSFLGKKGIYTRKRGLDRGTNKELLLKHIRDNAAEGSRLDELMQVLPDLSRDQVQKLVQELKSQGLVHNLGRTRSARWYPGTADSE